MKKTDTKFELIRQLREHTAPVTAQALAKKLKISVATVYRHVAALREDGLQIEGDPGIGYVLRPGVVLRPVHLTDDELEALLYALEAGFSRGQFRRALTSVADKLRGALPETRDYPFARAFLKLTPKETREIGAANALLARVTRSIETGTKAEVTTRSERGKVFNDVVWPVAIGFDRDANLIYAFSERRNQFISMLDDEIRDWTTTKDPIGKSRTLLMAEWREQGGHTQKED